MENKTSEEKPNGRIKILPSGGMFYWGVDRDGVMWQKWGTEKWKRAQNKKEEQTCCNDYLNLNISSIKNKRCLSSFMFGC